MIRKRDTINRVRLHRALHYSRNIMSTREVDTSLSLINSHYLKLRFLVHAAAANVRPVDITEWLAGCIVHREARSYHAEVLLHAAEEIRAFHRDSLRGYTENKIIEYPANRL